MRRLLLMGLLIGLTLSAPGAQSSPAGSRKSAASKPAAPARPKPPASPATAVPYAPPPQAERLPDGGYRWTDPSGIVWIYKQSPFGWGRMKEADLPRAQSAGPVQTGAPAVVSVEDDKVQFREEGPFGAKSWWRPRGELNPAEAAALKAYEASPRKGANDQAAKSPGKEKN